MNLVMEYITALNSLYGLFHKEKVVEIYNMQNDDQITVSEIEKIMENEQEYLGDHHVYVVGDYFVHETIMEFDEFDLYLKRKSGKPYYIPGKSELLKYTDPFYFEKNKQYRDLVKYVETELVGGNRVRAGDICEDIQGMCQIEASLVSIIEGIGYHVELQSEKQVNKIVDLITDLNNNTRIWSNNGYTPSELFEFEKQHLRPLSSNRDNPVIPQRKIGRNEQCPCGSGKKYKKCCL